MRVLFVHDDPRQFGGAEIYMDSLRSELASRGHIVRLLSRRIAGYNRYEDYVFQGADRVPLKYLIQVYNPWSRRSVDQVVKEYRPDIVHVHNLDKQASTSFLAHLALVPTVMTVHDMDLVAAGIRNQDSSHVCAAPTGGFCPRCTSIGSYSLFRVKTLVRRRALRNIDLFIALNDLAETLLLRNGIGPTVKIHNGIRLLERCGPARTDTLLYVGRLTADKGIFVLLDALHELMALFPNVRLLVVGRGPDEMAFRSKMVEMGLEHHVLMVGHVGRESIRQYYAEATVVVVPSLCADNLPTVCLEAMSAARVVVGSRIGGIPELIEDGTTGCLVDPGEPGQLVEQLKLLLMDREMLTRMGEMARRAAEEQYDIKKHTDVIEDVYRRVIATYSKSGRVPEKCDGITVRHSRTSPPAGSAWLASCMNARIMAMRSPLGTITSLM